LNGLISAIVAGLVALCVSGCARGDLKSGLADFKKTNVEGRTLAMTPVQGLEITDTALFTTTLKNHGVPADSAAGFITEVFSRAFQHYVEMGRYRFDSAGGQFSDTTMSFQYDSLLIRRSASGERNSSTNERGYTVRDTTLVITVPVVFRLREPRMTADSAMPDYSITISRAVFRPRRYSIEKIAYGASTGGGCTGTEIAATVDFMIWNHREGTLSKSGRLETGSAQCGEVKAESWILAVDETVRKIVRDSPFRGAHVYDRPMAQSERAGYLFMFMKKKRVATIGR
jgi:hypothetical protein